VVLKMPLEFTIRHQIGFGFVPTSLHVLDILNERGKVYQAEVLRCVEKLKG